MFPVRNLKKQMETLLQACCFETVVTCAKADSQGSCIKRMAIHMGQYMAIYLAEIITGLLQRVLTRPERGLVNETNAALLTPKFWVHAIYTELLLASSRLRAVRRKDFFFPAVPSEHRALSVNFRGMRKQKSETRITCRRISLA